MRAKICGRSQWWLFLAAVLLFGGGRPLCADFRFTLTGDPRSDLARWEWTLNQVEAKVGDEGAFHITAGDYYEEDAETVAADFYNSLKAQFGSDVVWYPTVGNHELEEGGSDMVWLRNFYYAHLAGTVNPGPPNGEETTYSWDYENAHFVQLNMYYDGTTDDRDMDEFSDALYEWLVEDLDRNTKPVVFVIYHQPAYPAGRGDKDSPQGWQRFWKLLNNRGVVAGLCADTHKYARYQVDGDWDTVTWELDAGNAGRTSHGDSFQTFVDITVDANRLVQFNAWRGQLGQDFTLADSWVAVAPTVTLVGPADGATVDANGAVLSCEPIADAVSYKLLFGPDPQRMVYLVSETAGPPADVISTFPYGQTWWTIKVRTARGRRVYGEAILINAQNVGGQVIENASTAVTYDCIQDAIDSAGTGEEIIVDPGPWQYYGNIDFKGKTLSLRSTNPHDPTVVAATVLRGPGYDPVVTFSGREPASCTLSGFTITDGNEGIHIFGASPTITNCHIVGNRDSGIESWRDIFWRWAGNIVNCTVAANGGIGIFARGRKTPTVTNCIVAGNNKAGIDVDERSTISNCTIFGNDESGIYCYNTTVTNCIVWGNGLPQLVGEGFATPVTYNNVQGGYTGEGNIDADPIFARPGRWAEADNPNIAVDAASTNPVWVAGDYHLLPGSPCIDAGANAGIAPDVGDLDGDGNTAEPTPSDPDGEARVIDGDSDSNSTVDMGAYEASPGVEIEVKFTPQSANPTSQGNWVKAHFVLPQGFGLEDLDSASPALLVGPARAESEYMNVFINQAGLVEVEAAFDRSALCSNDFADRTISIVAVLSGTSGQYLFATDTVRIIDKTFEQLAGFASHWLTTGCTKPDWCADSDLDQDGTVDFQDLALFDGCCIEIAPE
ncbi:MAG: right-handed parallel beta-helix repeat-containing protein [Planctomycetota bacterium]